MTPNANLFAALRAAFPADLDAIAIEAVGATDDTAPQCYRWRDLERGTAMLANLLASLDLPEGSRVAVQTEKSVEALMLYLAVLRAGLVYLPLNTAYQRDEIGYFIGNAEPAIVVCAPKNFGWVSRIAFAAGSRTCSRSATTAAAACCSAPRCRATCTSRQCGMPTTSPRSSTPAAPPAAARARC